MIKTISVVVLNNDGKILALKRSLDRKCYPGKWDIISGKFEYAEDAEACFWRELREEIGHADVTILNRPAPYIYMENGLSWLVHPYLCQNNNNIIKLNHEHTEFKWMEVEELLNADHAKPIEAELGVFF